MPPNLISQHDEPNFSEFGAGEGCVLDFGSNRDPRRKVPYLDLIDENKISGVRPRGVVEFNGRPVLYYVDARSLSVRPDDAERELRRLRRILACRGDGRFMAVTRPGVLEIFKVTMDPDPGKPLKVVAGRTDTQTLLPSLALQSGFDSLFIDKSDPFVADLLYKLMADVTDRLNDLVGDPGEALALSARTLFFRFLADRRIVRDYVLQEICPEALEVAACMVSVERVARTFRWLDETFHGDLMPLPKERYTGYQQYFEHLGLDRSRDVIDQLKGIMLRAEPVGGKDFQQFLWGDIDFGHVPVGLLSQIYERYCHRFEKKSAKSASVHYTPRHIAAYMVDEAFAGLGEKAAQARVLDPAAGAGVFLVLCLHRLVGEAWECGQRPDTAEIRRILREQIVGFEINDTALKLTALSLYLTALELDPDPFPPEKLRFDRLYSGEHPVLFNFRAPDDPPTGAVLGSLGPSVGGAHRSRYHLVIGNPPWTSFEGELGRQLGRLEIRPAHAQGASVLAQHLGNPDNVPDLAFIAKATEWAVSGGIIAYAIHARLLFKTTNPGQQARLTLFEHLNVTGVLNGADLRETEVWPDMRQPFCLLFARNEPPQGNSSFCFVSPYMERQLNDKQQSMRIDAVAAQPIPWREVVQRPTLLKTLFRGTALDVAIIDKIRGAPRQTVDGNPETVGSWWPKNKTGRGVELGTSYSSVLLDHHKEFIPASIPDLEHFILAADRLNNFDTSKMLRWPVNQENKVIYQPPLFLLGESPRTDRLKGRAWLSSIPTAYNRSFYGYSGSGTKTGARDVKYLFVLAMSNVFIYHALMTSARFGVEREAVQKGDFDDLPFVEPDRLTFEQREEIGQIASSLMSTRRNDVEIANRLLGDLDRLVSEIYGLDARDFEVIHDSLEVASPFAASLKKAQSIPNHDQMRRFIDRLVLELSPFYKASDRELRVALHPQAERCPWAFLHLDSRGQRQRAESRALGTSTTVRSGMNLPWAELMAEADRSEASYIFCLTASELIVGILKQCRFWTPSRARLLASDILLRYDHVAMRGSVAA